GSPWVSRSTPRTIGRSAPGRSLASPHRCIWVVRLRRTRSSSPTRKGGGFARPGSRACCGGGELHTGSVPYGVVAALDRLPYGCGVTSHADGALTDAELVLRSALVGCSTAV